MHFLLPKISIAVIVFALWNNVFPTAWLASPRVDIPVTSVSNNHPFMQNSSPSGWRKIDADGKFSFYLPPDMRDTGVRGIENLHHEYTNGRMHLSFDYEPIGILAYPNRARAFGKNFQETELQVDGRKSYLFVYQSSDRKNRPTHNADFYVGDLPNGQAILHMWMSSRSAQNIETAKRIFQTIKFL